MSLNRFPPPLGGGLGGRLVTFKHMFKNLLLALSFIGLLYCGGMTPLNADLNPKEKQMSATRAMFLSAENALARGKMTAYLELKPKLKNYSLYPYLLFTEYDRKLPNLEFKELEQFLNQYKDSPLAETLRTKYLQSMAKQEQWDNYILAYQQTEDVSLQCQYIWAQLQTKRNPKIIIEQILPLWMTGKDSPKACEAIFKVWEKSSYMTESLVWQRIRLAIQAGNEKLARTLSRYLKQTEVHMVELWMMVHNNPYLVTQKKYFNSHHPVVLEMITHGVSLIAKTKPETAKEIWKQIGKEYPFKERHWGLVVRAIGLSFALQKNKEAEKWLSKIPNDYANDSVHEWRLRIALSKEDWPSVLKWIKNLPEHLAHQEVWQYWHARALDRIHQSIDAQNLYLKVAQNRSYYGFLASQQLLKPYTIMHQKMNLDATMLATLAQKGGVIRAKELVVLGRTEKGRSEWLCTTQQMTDEERHAAATLALKWNMPNWSILALSKAKNKNDLELRFPLAHAQHIIREANHTHIDPALIFAVTRQESAFMHNAKSKAGALGLMQLMPTTATMVAKKHFIPLQNHPQHIMEPSTNIQLGSRYLKMLLEKHDHHPILATAAYNAGPGRVKQWLPERDMSADAWIEMIPFKETREYVKNVMTYTIIYQQLLGRHPETIPIPRIPASKLRAQMNEKA